MEDNLKSKSCITDEELEQLYIVSVVHDKNCQSITQYSSRRQTCAKSHVWSSHTAD